MQPDWRSSCRFRWSQASSPELGCSLILTFAPTLFGARSLASLWESQQDPPSLNWHLALFAVLLFAFTLFAKRLLPARVPTMPVTVIAGIAAFHGLRLAGYDAQLGSTLAADGGWSILGDALRGTPRLASDGAALMSDVRTAGALLISSATLALVGLLDTVFGAHAAQRPAEGPGTPRRNMIGLGIGTMVAAVFGGVGISTSFSLTAANYQAGGRTRLSTIAASLILLIIVLAVPGALSAVPLCILPPLIILVGWGMLDPYTGAVLQRALSVARGRARTQTRRDSLIHLSVLVPTALNEPLWGVAIGIVLSCLVFILSMSRPVVRRARDGSTVTSKRLRTRSETERLAARGDALAVLDLEGPLFFGNAEDLASAIRTLEPNAFRHT